jgi:beta-N-acetylhexosaminidase
VLVADYGVRAIGVYRAAGMMPVVGHFPGIGAAAQDPEEGPANVGLTAEELARRDLVPFRAAIERGRAPAVLVGHGLYAEADVVTPASLSRAFTTDLLRGTLGFRGIAVADDLSSPAITAVASIPDAAVDALNAGADMLIVSGPLADQEATYVAVLNAVRKRQVARRRIDEALLRILIQKRRFGLILEEGEQAPAPGGQAPPAGAAP